MTSASSFTEYCGVRGRNALHDRAEVRSHLRFSGRDDRHPVATIAITTFNRPDLLIEAVQSALAQDCDFPFEIAIFDNQPGVAAWEELVARVPALAQANFRYWQHDENIGMFGNFNRCIQFARGEWLTILADDDLLDPQFLRLMFAEITRRPEIDGLVCHKRTQDERTLRHAPPTALHRTAMRALAFSKFGLNNSRRIRASHMFWWPGGVVGTPTGFLFRKAAAQRLGGFDPDQGMAADYWFTTRFATTTHLRQLRDNLAITRIARNESAKPETLSGFVREAHKVRQSLTQAGRLAPWFDRFSPLIVARQHAYHRDYWHVETAPADIEAMLGTRLTRDRPLLFKACRMLFGGY